MTNSQLVQAQATRCVARHLTDPRPAWLWTENGGTALWQNASARAFKPKLKRKAKSDLVPIGRQIARALRLGVEGRASLSRMQFTIGRKPISLTCTCTPLTLADGGRALLVVGVDAVERDGAEPDASTTDLAGLPGLDIAHVVVDAAGQLVAGHDEARFLFERMAQTEAEHFPFETVRLDAGSGAEVVFFLPRSGSEAPSETVVDSAGPAAEPLPAEPAPKEGERADLAMDVPTDADKAPEREEDPKALEPGTAASEHTPPALSALVDRLAAQETLYAPIGEETEERMEASAEHSLQTIGTGEEEAAAAPTDRTDAEADEPDAVETAQTAETAPQLWRIVGRRITLHESVALALPPKDTREEEALLGGQETTDTSQKEKQAGTPAEEDKSTLDAPPTEEEGKRLEPVQPTATISDPQAKYNFDELTRLLSDSMRRETAEAEALDGDEHGENGEEPGADDQTSKGDGGPSQTGSEVSGETAPETSGILSLSDEYLILNRLSLGLLVFRDQDILFANRALTELVGFSDSATLRRAGLEAIFPSGDDPTVPVGAVTHLVKVDGTLVPVNARLQTITWRGRQALLLSAHERLERPGAEALVRDFAKTFADVEQSGFFETSRAGVISAVSGRCAELLDRTPDLLIGRPIYGLIALSEGSRLRKFLDQPARFAGEARPSITLAGSQPGLSVMLFAEGQAGIITGYFGFVRQSGGIDGAEPHLGSGLDPAQLIRLARGIRRPLNSIIGFSDLIRLSTFGPIENGRYVDYARDIKTAGFDIVGLVDELEDYARLCEEGYAPAVADFNLSDLLDQCVSRIRGYAGQSRVLVRSAISNRLPLIKADKTSLGQAILNLMATAIAHTPSGGQVVLSANVSAGRGVEVHIRDSADEDAEAIEERFVVFRDGVDAEGQPRKPLRSALGLTLTRSLLAINQCTLRFDPTGGASTLMSLTIPSDMVAQEAGEEGKGADL